MANNKKKVTLSQTFEKWSELNWWDNEGNSLRSQKNQKWKALWKNKKREYPITLQE